MTPAIDGAVVLWNDFLPVAERAFGVWTHRDDAVQWGARTWKLLDDRGLVPHDDSARGNAIALTTLLALANVYRDFCQAAFDEVSDIADVAYAAEDASPVVSQAALARLAGEMDVDTGLAEYDSLTAMVEGLIRWRRPDVVRVLLQNANPQALLSELWLTCLSPSIDAADGAPHGAEDSSTVAEPWSVGGGSPMAAYAWVAAGCPQLSV